MVCQNCKSKDILSIQEQRYCLNCGQLVIEKAAKPPAATLPQPDVPPTEKVISIMNHGKALSLEGTPLTFNQSKKAKKKVPAASPSPAKPVKPISAAAPVARRLNDLQSGLGKGSSVETSKAVMKPLVKKSAKIPIKPTPKARPIASSRPVPKPAHRLGAWPDLKRASTLLRSGLGSGHLVLLAALVSLPLIAFWYGLLGQSWAEMAVAGESLIPAGPMIFVSTLTVVSLLAVLAFIWTENAALYGLSKKLDTRSLHFQKLAQVGNESLPAMLGLALLSLPILWLLISLLVRLTPDLSTAVQSGSWLYPGALSLVFLQLLAASAIFLLAHYAVVIGGQRPIKALAVGWRIFWHNLGGSLAAFCAATLGLCIGLIILLSAGWGALRLTNWTSQYPLLDLGSAWLLAAVSVITVSLAIAYGHGVWLSLYHQAVRQSYAGQLGLLAGRNPRAIGRSGVAGWLTLVALALTLLGVLSWQLANQPLT